MYNQYENKMQTDYVTKNYNVDYKQYNFRLQRDLANEFDNAVKEKHININETIRQFIIDLIAKINSN